MLKFPLTEQQINSLSETDIGTLIHLDKNGILYGSDESFENFIKRIKALHNDIENINSDLASGNCIEIEKMKFYPDDLISSNIFDTTNKFTEKYSFSINWAPGFFANRSIGLLTGGFTAVSDSGVSIFILRKGFKGKTKWFIYSLNELLTHELCHVARAPIADNSYEEYFAYKLSPSKFRQYFGGLFHSQLDSLFLLLPIFLMLIITLIKIFYFICISDIYLWIFSLIYPVFLFIRNFYFRRIYKKAYKALSGIVNNEYIDSILFRCTTGEIKIIANSYKLKKHSLISKLKEFEFENLKWKIIFKRFILN